MLCMLNFLGAVASFSVVAGLPWTATMRFFDEVSGEADELAGVTFAGWVDAQGTRYELRCVRTEGVCNELVLEVPALPVGRWPFEVAVYPETGEPQRLMHGFCTAVGQEYHDDGTAYDGRTLDVLLPGDAQRRLRLEWRASTAAQLAAEQAKRTADGVKGVAEGAQEALHAAQDAVQKLDGVQDAVGAADALKKKADATKEEIERILQDAPREYVPTIVNGTWWLNGVDTGIAATGKDGADGVTLVRHLVQRVEDIPTSGPTCNGGHVYYVPCVPTFASGWVHDLTSGSVDWYMHDFTLEVADKVLHFRESASEREFIDGINNGQDLVTAEMDAVGYGFTLTARKVGRAGNAIAFAAYTTYTELECSGETLSGGRGREGALYEVYVWLEGAGWVPVDSDGTVEHQKPVPVATYYASGTVTLGTATLTDGGFAVGVGSDGRMRVEIPHASNSRFGLIKLGSYIVEVTRQPYIVGIGATADGQLANNLLVGGALKHMRRDDWLQADGRIDPAVFPDAGAYCMGLHVSAAFTQSEEVGLDLAPATTEHLGGVAFTEDPHDEREGRVLTLRAMLERFLSREVLEQALSAYIRTNDTLTSVMVMTREEYDRLEHIEAKTLYIVR